MQACLQHLRSISCLPSPYRLYHTIFEYPIMQLLSSYFSNVYIYLIGYLVSLWAVGTFPSSYFSEFSCALRFKCVTLPTPISQYINPTLNVCISCPFKVHLFFINICIEQNIEQQPSFYWIVPVEYFKLILSIWVQQAYKHITWIVLVLTTLL